MQDQNLTSPITAPVVPGAGLGDGAASTQSPQLTAPTSTPVDDSASKPADSVEAAGSAGFDAESSTGVEVGAVNCGD